MLVGDWLAEYARNQNAVGCPRYVPDKKTAT